jgi:hypothetical protein
MILPVCGCEIRCDALVEYRLRMFENRVWGKIFRPGGGGMRKFIGEWRQLRTKELHD